MAASVKGNFNGENAVVGCCNSEIQCEGTFTDTPPNSGQVQGVSSRFDFPSQSVGELT